MNETREILSTGITSLDSILGGGLPARQSLVVTGNPGSGKTLLCSQIAFSFAARGMPVAVATVTSESHDKLLDDLSSFSFCDQRRIGQEMVVLSAYPWLKKGGKEAREMLLGTVRERGARLLFVDGLRAIRDLWQDEAMLREFMYDLSVGLAASECIGVFSTEYDIARLLTLPEATTVDGILSLSVRAVGSGRRRRAEVVKLRGRAHLQGEHVFEISEHGTRFFPRLESSTESDPGYEPAPGRASFELKELDALLGGGLPRESATLAVGSTGIGKTLLGLSWASAAAKAGEKGLFVSFYEPAQSLVRRAAGIGLDVRPHLATGALEIDYHAPLELDADQLAHGILERLTALDARRLVIDGLAEVERALVERDRTRDFLTALMIELRRRKVTTIFTKEISKIAGLELDISDTPTSLIAENLLFLRTVELRGRLHRVLSILKMRASDYDTNFREFQITSKGFEVMNPIRSASGLLTGVAQPLGDTEE